MSELIKITNENGKQTVNARELHEFLGIATAFKDWIKNSLDFIEAVEGHDYAVLENKLPESIGNSRKDYFITLEVAKELSMIQRNEKGKEARRYFIECEKKLKENAPSSFAEALRLAYEQKNLTGATLRSLNI